MISRNTSNGGMVLQARASQDGRGKNTLIIMTKPSTSGGTATITKNASSLKKPIQLDANTWRISSSDGATTIRFEPKSRTVICTTSDLSRSSSHRTSPSKNAFQNLKTTIHSFVDSKSLTSRLQHLVLNNPVKSFKNPVTPPTPLQDSQE